jgi:hypothetical protein
MANGGYMIILTRTFIFIILTYFIWNETGWATSATLWLVFIAGEGHTYMLDRHNKQLRFLLCGSKYYE